MAMWLRLGGALLITFAVMAALEYFGVSSIAGDRSQEDMPHATASRTRELFWLAVFAVVMAMSVVAAVRRWTEQVRHALFVSPQLKRRQGV